MKLVSLVVLAAAVGYGGSTQGPGGDARGGTGGTTGGAAGAASGSAGDLAGDLSWLWQRVDTGAY